MSEKKKNVLLLSSLGCAIAGASCGIPFILGLWGSRPPGIPYPRFVLGSNDSGQELHIPAKDLIRHKGSGGKIPFNQVNMKWGFRKLKDQDVLISTCKNGNKFYVGTHKWDSEYLLHNGKKFFLSRENCCCNGEIEEQEQDKLIKLNSSFKQISSNGNGGGGGESRTNGTEASVSNLILLVNTCTFSLNKADNKTNSDKWNLKMDCKGYTKSTNSNVDSGSNNGQGGTCEQKDVSLTLDSSYYKPRYIPTIKSTTK